MRLEPADDPTYNPTSIGFDIETGGHMFQLHFSNAVGMNERAFLTDADAPTVKKSTIDSLLRSPQKKN